MSNKKIIFLAILILSLFLISNVDAAENSTENLEVVISGDNDSILSNSSNIVTNENFNSFFDENGNVLGNVTDDELIFKGQFANVSSDKIILNRSISIIGEGAVLKDISIVVGAGGVSLSNLNISYAGQDVSAIAIDIKNVNDVHVNHCNVYLETNITRDEKSASAINVENSSNIFIDENIFNTSFPGLYMSNYDSDYMMGGLNTVNPVRIRGVKNLTFRYNTVDSRVKSMSGSYPVVQSLYVVGTTNALFEFNNFKIIDEVSNEGSTAYLYVASFGYDKNVTISNNSFELYTKSGAEAAGSAIAIQGSDSELLISANNFTTQSNGPNMGIYVASMAGGSSTISIEGNAINVTGYANSSSTWSLVSGIEIQNGFAAIYSNKIHVYNKAGCVEQSPVYGISYSQYLLGNRSFDIRDNFVYVQGKYTISLLNNTEANITNNKLYSEILSGDDSVSSGTGANVDNNTNASELVNPSIFIEVENITCGETAFVNVTLQNDATGNITVIIENDTFHGFLEDGFVSVAITNLSAGNYIVDVHYSGDSKYAANSNSTLFSVSPDVLVFKNETRTMLLVNSANVYLGDNITVTAIVSNQNSEMLAGTVDVYVNSTFLGSKNINEAFAYSPDKLGKYVIEARFNETSEYNASSASVSVNVIENVVPEEMTSDDDGIVILEFPVDAGGEVEVFIDGVSVEVVKIVNGIAIIDLSKYKGNYTVSFVYSGDEKYSGFTRESNVTVNVNTAIITAKDTKVLYTAGQKFSVTVYEDENVAAKSIPVEFKVNGKYLNTYNTNANGVASFKVTQTPGTYKVQVTALGKTVTKTLTVKHLVTLKKVTVKRSAKKLVLTATLAKVNKKYLKNKKITFKFNGKKYTAKTNKKGVAKVTIKSTVLKKLKAGKKITYHATYLKDTVKQTVKVKK